MTIYKFTVPREKMIKAEKRFLSASAMFVWMKTWSALYFYLLLAMYLSILITRMTSKPEHHHDVEPGEFLMYMYIVSIIYLTSIIFWFARASRTIHNHRSHGSAFLRQGSFVFGVGSIMYLVLEFVSSVVSHGTVTSDCQNLIHRVNYVLLIVFIILEIVVVIGFPRLNLRAEYGLSHMGLMHLIATNLILWIRTIIKESMLEFHEVLEEEAMELLHERTNTTGIQFSILTEELETSRPDVHFSTGKHEHTDGLMGNPDTESGYSCYWDLQSNHPELYSIIQQAAPLLFPFLIELSLIGCTFFFGMWSHINMTPGASRGQCAVRYHTNIKKYIKALDWSNSAIGLAFGLCIVVLNIVSLVLFYRYSSDPNSTDEFISKLINTIINSFGLLATCTAVYNIQKLGDKKMENGQDCALLYISGFFLIIYSILEILVGVHEKQDYRGGIQHRNVVNVLNGVVSVIATLMQILFLNQTFVKGVEPEEQDADLNESKDSSSNHSIAKNGVYPGRQEMVFLALLNISQWFIFTFELQRSKANKTEAEYFGALTWVVIQRITLPLAIFFRFHSALVLVDSWKNNYKRHHNN